MTNSPQRSRPVLDRAPGRGTHPAAPVAAPPAPAAPLPPASAAVDVDPEVNYSTRLRASARDRVNLYVVGNKRAVPGLSQGKLTEVALRRLFDDLDAGRLSQAELGALVKEIG